MSPRPLPSTVLTIADRDINLSPELRLTLAAVASICICSVASTTLAEIARQAGCAPSTAAKRISALTDKEYLRGGRLPDGRLHLELTTPGRLPPISQRPIVVAAVEAPEDQIAALRALAENIDDAAMTAAQLEADDEAEALAIAKMRYALARERMMRRGFASFASVPAEHRSVDDALDELESRIGQLGVSLAKCNAILDRLISGR